MFLLYLDDSGSANNADEEYLVLGGICVSERQVSNLTVQLDGLAGGYNAADPESIEFHASEIFSRKKSPWNRFKQKEDAQAVLKSVLAVAANAAQPASLVACAIHKKSFAGQNPMEICFREVCCWFEDFLRNRHKETATDERGMLVVDEHAMADSMRRIARDFRRDGYAKTGSVYLIEGPHFVSSATSRCMQLADHVAYSVFRRFNAQDNNYLNVVLNRFQSDGCVLNGLRHLRADKDNCTCPCCLTIRSFEKRLVKA